MQQKIDQDVAQSAGATQEVAGNLAIELSGKFLPHSEVNVTVDGSGFSSYVSAYNNASNYNSVSVSTTASNYGHDHHDVSQDVLVEGVQQSLDQDVLQLSSATQEVAGNVAIELSGKFLPHSEVNVTIDDSSFYSTVYASNSANNSNSASNTVSVYTSSYSSDPWY